MTAPIELYYWPTPNGHKISIALEEMGLPYDVRPVNIGKGDQFKPEFLAISPNNRMPAIVDPEGPDGKAISIFESGAIMQYLGRKTGKLYGSNERERVAVEQWLMWQMGGLGPMMGQANHFIKYAPNLDPPQILPYAQERYRNETARLLGVMEGQLGRTEYLAGDYSIADIASFSWARHADPAQLETKPRLSAWLNRIGARPAVEKGLAVGADLRNPVAKREREEQTNLYDRKYN